MQYDDVTTNPRLRKDAILALYLIAVLGLSDKRQKPKLYNDV